VPPTITFAVPTIDPQRPLLRCLASIAPQLLTGDEVLVIGDTHDGPLPHAEEITGRFGPQFRYLELDAGHHCWGHCQLNFAMTQAKGDYWHANDDDDVWLRDAAKLMREGAEKWPKRLILFRFLSQFGTVYWDEVGRVERDHIGGHCIFAPLIWSKMGRYACVYSGDFDYIVQTVAKFGGANQAIWLDDIICRARPPL
jgi:glycosyltransferase involved in cell wall biosynthesis